MEKGGESPLHQNGCFSPHDAAEQKTAFLKNEPLVWKSKQQLRRSESLLCRWPCKPAGFTSGPNGHHLLVASACAPDVVGVQQQLHLRARRFAYAQFPAASKQGARLEPAPHQAQQLQIQMVHQQEIST
jgi:hypothetical protein